MIARHKSWKSSIAAPRLRNYGECLPKARRLALGLTRTAAPQLIAQLTQVTLKILWISEVCYSSPKGRGNFSAACQEFAGVYVRDYFWFTTSLQSGFAPKGLIELTLIM